MIVFKTFLRVLKKCKVPILIYTAMLLFFGAFNMSNSENQVNFSAVKPDIFIINQDEEIGITKDFIEYMQANSVVKQIKEEKDAIADALFYRDVSYIIQIPESFRKDFLAGKNPKIEVKSTGDYEASFAQMLVERYLKIAKMYQEIEGTEEELIRQISTTLEKQTEVELTSKLDTDTLSKASFYFNFANYSILAGCVYVICLILASFKEEKIHKRTSISSMNYQKYNRQLLLSNSLFAISLWIFYVLLSFVLIGNSMLSLHGFIYILNSFVFTLCALTIAFVIGNLVQNKNAINGIVNVVALGSSFLCGAFVPMEFLPDFVLKIAHILPSYWYIKSNEMIKTLEVINLENLKPVLLNFGVLFIFTIIFISISKILAGRKIAQ